jgi:hypothetical protein
MHSLIRPIFAGPLALAILLTTLVVPSAASAATAPITFDMTIYGNCVSGWTGGADVHVVWRDSGGALKADGIVTDRWSSWFEFCPSDSTLAVTPGDQIKISTHFANRTYTVPNLTLRLDRVTNLASGTGPAARNIQLCSGWGWYIGFGSCRSVRVGQDGQWGYNPHTDLFGGIEAYLFWKSPKGDRLYVFTVAPFLRVTIGKAEFEGFTQPFANVDVSLDGSVDATGHATAEATGRFEGTLRDSASQAVQVSPGDRISAPSFASDADWVVPTIVGRANKLTEIVKGGCLNSVDSYLVWVSIVGPLGNVRGSGLWHTNSEGRFRAGFRNYYGGGDVPVTANVKSGDTVRIDCVQSTGDETRWSFIVP